MTEDELTQVQELLRRCIDEYQWMWGVTKKFIHCRTGKIYETKDLKKIYAAMHTDSRRN